MKSKNIKVVDQNKIDRNAFLMFAFDLESSEYVAYSIERDDDESNLFVSKIIKNGDGTSNLLDIDVVEEKTKLSAVVKMLVSKAVKDENDKFVGDSVVLDDGNVVKFVDVFFNKEQNMNIEKTYVATVGKNVTRVVNEYYDSVVLAEPKVVEEIFPTISPVETKVEEDPVLFTPTVEPSVTDNLVSSEGLPNLAEEALVPEVSESSNTPISEVLSIPEDPILSTPVVEVSNDDLNDDFIAFGTESTIPKVEEAPHLIQEGGSALSPEIVEPITMAVPSVSDVKEESLVSTVEASTLENDPHSSIMSESEEVEAPVVVNSEPSSTMTDSNVEVSPTVEPEVVQPQPLVFNASKETNLNAALGEVASDTVIPVENIEPVREFGVDDPVKPVVQPQQSGVAPMVQPPVSTDPKTLSRKGGFANNKFFMVIAIAFFLASCVFLGYEVFNYFQLVK